jgi:predicted ArsR family transcriptional regulator
MTLKRHHVAPPNVLYGEQAREAGTLTRRRIMLLIRDGRASTASQVAAALGMESHGIRAHLTRLVNCGALAVVPAAGSRPATYALARPYEDQA